MTDQRRTVAQAGEDTVLAAVREVIDPFNAGRTGLEIGPGDDAAALTVGSGQAVITTDTMSQGQDFRRQWWGNGHEWPMDVGTKAAAQNLSDISAMGAVPTALVVSLTLPPEIPLSWVRDFYRGVIRACRQPGAERCVIAGGDLGSGETISVTITAVGEPAVGEPVQGGRLLRRDEARAGNMLAVAGRLGRAAAGLALLEQSGAEPVPGPERQLGQVHAETIRECLRAQQRPEPPLIAGPAALAAGATAGMDLSDGLLRDAGRLAKASGVQIRLDEALLHAEAEPLVPVAGVLGLSQPAARDWVLTGGEDYGLLVTFPAEADLPSGFRVLGTVEALPDGDSPGVVVPSEPSVQGWDSLKR
ncbi:thiamine-phosphate kinase [Nesterenkonia ebinurensis]|uniref:thiamine-phosphate kinase n=1 Tax=Nesterenkonia ebinurensis TaxID=2608252 RepID=UPI00123D07C8|nr:thiamine-phosphate kinase [Nesterenkonia ebinurensis]